MSAPNGNGNGELPFPEGIRLGTDQTAADADQTDSDLDQTASDSDQELADREQDQANIDQASSERDQAAANREVAAHPDWSEPFKEAYEVSREARDASTIARDATTLARATTATERRERAARRDHSAHLRDLTAEARDLAAEAVDRAAIEQEHGEEALVTGSDRAIHDAAIDYVGLIREDAAKVRVRAAADRAQAAKDRERAAQDREEAARDREDAQAALRHAHLDDLTGALQRGVGLVTLQHEIDRAREAGGSLVLALVDVDDLEALNDAASRAAGDSLLRAVVGAMRSKMRSYEPIVRFGGDEFACVFAGMDVDAAQARSKEIQGALDRDQDSGTITIGLAALDADDSLDDLIGRADAALVEARKS